LALPRIDEQKVCEGVSYCSSAATKNKMSDWEWPAGLGLAHCDAIRRLPSGTLNDQPLR
jgi:hypothetical protein